MNESKPAQKARKSKHRRARPGSRADSRAGRERAAKQPERPAPAGAKRQGRAAGRRGPRPGGGLWLYGTHAVIAALANPARRLQRLLATPEAAAAQAQVLKSAPAAELLSREALARALPEGAVHQGLAALVEPLPPADLGALLAGGGAGPEAARGAAGRHLLLALDQVTDPQNCGAILRSAAAFGAAGVISPARHSAPESGALAKAASGALELVPRVEVGNLAQALARLKAAGYWVLGLAEDGAATLPDLPEDPGGRVVLVLGAEGRGLRRLTRESCDRLVRLPTRPALPSLNVSNAAAVALYALLCR